MVRLSRVWAALCLSAMCAAGSAAEFPDYHFVHTSGEAFMYVTPDNSEIVFDLRTSDPNPELAFSRINERIAQLQALMAAQALPDALSISDVKREQLAAKDGNPEAAQMKCSVRIKVDDLSKWKAVIAPVLNMPDVDKLSVFFDTTQREDIDNQLLVEASKNARKRADVIARAFGRQLTTASAISDGQLRNLTASIGLVTSNGLANRQKRLEPAADLTGITVMKFAKGVDVVYRTK